MPVNPLSAITALLQPQPTNKTLTNPKPANPTPPIPQDKVTLSAVARSQNASNAAPKTGDVDHDGDSK